MGELLIYSFLFGALIFVIISFFQVGDFLGLIFAFWMLGSIPAALYLSYNKTKERLERMEKKLETLLTEKEEQDISE